MATQFISSFGNGCHLTSEDTVIKARTDNARIDVRLECENGAGGNIETFYSTTLYPFDGIVELAGVGSLVEEYFRLRYKVHDIISVVFDNIAIDVDFIYCEHELSLDFDIEKQLLVAVPSQRVRPDSAVAFATLNRGENTPFTIKAVGHRAADGKIVVLSKNESHSLSDCTAWFDVPSVLWWALGKSSDKVGADALSDLLYFSIEYAGLQKLCYIVPAPAYLTFSFRNIFNVLESIDIVGTISTNTQVSRDIAVCNGISTPYDRNVSRTFEVHTEPVPPSEVPLFEQFLCSHMVDFYLNSNDYPVIITDFTSEPSTDDASLTTFKFTWRFAGKRPLIFDSLVNGIMPDRHNTFNTTFSPEYD